MHPGMQALPEAKNGKKTCSPRESREQCVPARTLTSARGMGLKLLTSRAVRVFDLLVIQQRVVQPPYVGIFNSFSPVIEI